MITARSFDCPENTMFASSVDGLVAVVVIFAPSGMRSRFRF